MIPRIQLLIDEAGIGQSGTDKVFVFAGFLGTVRQWERLTHAWDGLLKGPPLLTADGLKNAIRRKRNNRRVLKFVNALRESGLYRVECRIPKDAYDKAILSELPKWKG
ncbi:MAG: hypothetical protein WA861_12280, partial [Candidatus Binatus sp.]